MMFYEIPINLIRQYYFCPRIVYFRYLIGFDSHEQIWVQQGKKHHERQYMLMKNRNLSRFGIKQGKVFYSDFLKNDYLKIHGFADAVIATDTEVAPVEFKLSRSKITKGYFYQLAAYGVCAEIKYNKKCEKGFFLFEDKGKVLEKAITDEHKNEIAELLNNISRMLEYEIMPDSSASAHQCSQCEYLNFCNDRNF